jgi:hypothetical protein
VANPRKTPSRLGNHILTDTFIADGVTITFDRTLPGGATAAMLNKAVSLSADGTVQLTSDAEAVVGKLLLVEADLRCTVQTGGVCTLPGGLSATLTRGNKIIGATGTAGAKGFIRIPAASSAEAILARGQIWASDTATAVEVNLT